MVSRTRLTRLGVEAIWTTRHIRAVLLGFCLAGTLSPQVSATPCATDDLGREVCLDQPAARIAALSPGATELLFAAGAGDKVVAVVEFSDYPAQARSLPSVGSHTRIDLEALLALQPDLVIGWVTGNPREQVARLESLGLPVFSIEPRTVAGVATALERLGQLAGTGTVAEQEAERFREDIASLRQRYQGSDPVTVFYQVWDQPLMTVNDEHLIGEIIELCGGENVFGQLDRLVPRLDPEAVLAANPDVIITGGRGESDAGWLDAWRRFPQLKAVATGNLFLVPPSRLQRPTPRLVEGSRILCQQLENARAST